MIKLNRHHEDEIKIGNESRKVFFHDGFFKNLILLGNLHSHRYTEVIVVANGNIKYRIGNEIHEICNGESIAIPAGVYHYCIYADENVCHSTFQIDLPISSFRKCTTPQSVLSALLDNSNREACDVNRLEITGYLQLIVAALFTEFSSPIDKTTDTAFIIHEFFSRGYSLDLKLSDLAELLHLSEKQTARLVEIHMGKTFKQALIDKRMSIAKHLISLGELSFSEIGEHVGYQSYGGFYKAYTKHFGLSGTALPPAPEETD